MKNLISIKKLNKIYIPESSVKSDKENASLALALNAEMMSLGYVMSKHLFEVVSNLPEKHVAEMYTDVIAILKNIKGADVEYKPMYPNFPKQVMEASHYELFLNAIIHYWTHGTWKPNYQELPRELAFENVKFIELGISRHMEFYKIFTTLVSSNASLSEEDNTFVTWFLKNCGGLDYPDAIPFKETMCLVAATLIETSSLEQCISSATDVLRVMTHLSDGDVSLADNTKFKSLQKRYRRKLVSALEDVISEDDISRHKNKWIKAFHNLHIGDYSKQCPKTFAIAKKLRNKEKLDSFAGRVEAAFIAKDLEVLTVLLESRPGDFARRLDHVLRLAPAKSQDEVVRSFSNAVDRVSTRVLMQLMGHMRARNNSEQRVVFPKGSMQKALLLPPLKKVDKKSITAISLVIDVALKKRFAKQKSLGKTWVDPALAECPIPMQQRSASTGAFSVARGTRLPMGDKDTLRLFIYWVGQDIDLSATIHDADLKMIEQISYTNLKSNAYQSCHSGDITYAPNGAAEFIDINIDQAVAYGARYVVMNVLVYSGPKFSEHEKCYAGWMTKDHPNAGDIFDPKLVEQKIDLTSDAMRTIPVVFDLVERKGIWCDLVGADSERMSNSTIGSRFTPNNVETNRASIKDTLRSIINLGNKPSLHDLFMLHATSRGELVDNQEDAETIFSLDSGITPYNVSEINSNYLM